LQRLKRKQDEPLSNFAFTFDLRRYTMAVHGAAVVAFKAPGLAVHNYPLQVGRCRFTPD
jgi:hypothetical protein